MNETVRRIVASKGKKPTINDILVDAGLLSARGGLSAELKEKYEARVGEGSALDVEGQLISDLFAVARLVGVRRGGEIDVSGELKSAQDNLDRTLRPAFVSGKETCVKITDSFTRLCGPERQQG